MALGLNEYIRQSYRRPNRKILESLGASENLIKYLLHTSWNTNPNMLGNYINKNSWWAFVESKNGSLAISSDGILESEGMVTSKSYEEWNQLFTSPEKYRVFLKRWSDGRVFEVPWIMEEETGRWKIGGLDEQHMGYYTDIQKESYPQDWISISASVEGTELISCSIEVEVRG